jgi:hypothetical protein
VSIEYMRPGLVFLGLKETHGGDPDCLGGSGAGCISGTGVMAPYACHAGTSAVGCTGPGSSASVSCGVGSTIS